MTLEAQLQTIGSVVVGTSPAYAVTRSRATDRALGPDAQAGVAIREIDWELDCLAFAATAGDIANVQNSIRSDLVQRGEQVQFTDMGVARTLPEGGVASGSLAGYPTVELVDDPQLTLGTVLKFTLKIKTRIPNDAADLVEHEFERSETTDNDGNVTITQRGTVRTKNGVAAQTYADTNFITPEQTAATTAGQEFEIRWITTADTTVVRYELTRRDPDQDTGSPSVTQAQVIDRTLRQIDGRRIRRVSGFAVGSSAQSYADSQKPTTDASNILIREESTPPTIPDGRVNFLYEVLTGVTDAQFPGIVVYRFNETIAEVSGGRAINTGEYFGRTPLIRLGRERAYIYRQTSEMEFIGDWDSHGLTPLLDADNYASPPRVRKVGGRNELRRVTVTFTYAYDTAQALPNPRQIEGLE